MSEDWWLEEVRPALERRLGFSRRVLRFALHMPERQVRSNLTVGNTRVALCLFTKVLKFYRGIIELASIGRAESAMALVRSEFEACLGLHFVLRHRLRLYGKNTTGDLRSRLYMANEMLRWEDYCRNMGETPGMKRFGKQFKKERAFSDHDRTQLLQSIGPEWQKRLSKSPKTYSGLNTADLSKKLGRYAWYSVVFRLASRNIHSTDVLEQICEGEQNGNLRLRWKCSVSELEMALDLANQVMLGSTQIVGARFDYSSPFVMAIDGLQMS